jgi:hypothetical protein
MLPKLTIPMNRADPFFERDATGWQLIDVNTGRVSLNYNLYSNRPRTVAFDPKLGHPVDKQFQAETALEPNQVHY